LKEQSLDTGAGTVFLASLKARARGEHDTIEQVLNMMSESLTLALYVHRLLQFCGFYKPVKDQLGAAPPMAEWPGALGRRRKTALLRAALQALDMDLKNPALCEGVPAHRGAAIRLPVRDGRLDIWW
jgi:heme oxygenase